MDIIFAFISQYVVDLPDYDPFLYLFGLLAIVAILGCIRDIIF
jgi:hypothetical protein